MPIILHDNLATKKDIKHIKETEGNDIQLIKVSNIKYLYLQSQGVSKRQILNLLLGKHNIFLDKYHIEK